MFKEVKNVILSTVPLSSLEHAGIRPQLLFSLQTLWLVQTRGIMCAAKHLGRSDLGRRFDPLSDQRPDTTSPLRFKKGFKILRWNKLHRLHKCY